MRSLLLSLALLLGLPCAAHAESNFTRLNSPGPHAVGLRVVEQYDFSRGYRGPTDTVTGKPVTGERARPVQTLIWYPAETGAAPAMKVVDYLRLGAGDDDFSPPPAERAAQAARFVQGRVDALPPARAQAELAAPMLAVKDAAASAGQWPVVIYAPSFGAWSFENADLCEYLASQGYLVIASPSIGQASREMTSDLEGVEAQVADIRFLIGFAHGLPQADSSRVAVIGYSWGGLANVLAAAKDSRIGAVVSLDGSVRYWPDLVKQAGYATPARNTAPLLYLAARPMEIEELSEGRNKATSYLNRLKYADVYRVTLYPMTHPNFSVMFDQRLRPDEQYQDYDKAELSTAYAWLETYVRRFLDAYLKGDIAGRAFLDLPAASSGAPAHLLKVNASHSQGTPPTRASFAAELARRGADHASEIYQSFKAQEPDFSLPEDELNAWGYQLMGMGDRKAAVALLRLAAELNKESWNAFDSLGEAYANDGAKAQAIAAYRQSLVLNPKNEHAVAQLKVLGTKP